MNRPFSCREFASLLDVCFFRFGQRFRSGSHRRSEVPVASLDVSAAAEISAAQLPSYFDSRYGTSSNENGESRAQRNIGFTCGCYPG